MTVVSIICAIIIAIAGICVGSFCENKWMKDHGYKKSIPQLESKIIMKLPAEIKDDPTFGVRLLAFLQGEWKESWNYSQIWLEEYNYLIYRSCDIISEQFKDPNNKWYFDNMVKNCATYDEFVSKWYQPDFVEYLKKIDAI